MSVSQIFVVNSFTYLFFIAALLYVHMPDVKSTDRPKGWRQLGTGIRTVRERLVLRRLLFGMFLFSLFSLVFIGLFPSVSRLAFGIESRRQHLSLALRRVGHRRLFCGAMAVGTVFALARPQDADRPGLRRLRDLARPCSPQVRSPALAFPVAFVLGFTYFMTATAITTTLQLNMKNTERATVMPLWFMVFGGTVPIGNLIFGVVIEWIGVPRGARGSAPSSPCSWPGGSTCAASPSRRSSRRPTAANRSPRSTPPA